ncbi:hypothetical protein ABTM37_20945, partial [Acinetobacter baumannii]
MKRRHLVLCGVATFIPAAALAHHGVQSRGRPDGSIKIGVDRLSPSDRAGRNGRCGWNMPRWSAGGRSPMCEAGPG